MAVSATASQYTNIVRSVQTAFDGLNFRDAISNGSQGSSTTANTYLIPYQIIGYK